jgi:hypothetical protein
LPNYFKKEQARLSFCFVFLGKHQDEMITPPLRIILVEDEETDDKEQRNNSYKIRENIEKFNLNNDVR